MVLQLEVLQLESNNLIPIQDSLNSEWKAHFSFSKAIGFKQPGSYCDESATYVDRCQWFLMDVGKQHRENYELVFLRFTSSIKPWSRYLLCFGVSLVCCCVKIGSFGALDGTAFVEVVRRHMI